MMETLSFLLQEEVYSSYATSHGVLPENKVAFT